MYKRFKILSTKFQKNMVKFRGRKNARTFGQEQDFSVFFAHHMFVFLFGRI